MHRLRGGWQYLALLLVVFEFALPFLLLLARETKTRGHRLAAVACLVLALRFVDIYWWVEAAYPESMSFYWILDLAAFAAIGGLWTWLFVWQIQRASLIPLADPYLTEYLPEVAG